MHLHLVCGSATAVACHVAHGCLLSSNASVVICSVPDVAASVSTAAGAQSPFIQLQQQQLQFLANALQLQSQLKAHTQHGGSAGCCVLCTKLQLTEPCGSTDSTCHLCCSTPFSLLFCGLCVVAHTVGIWLHPQLCLWLCLHF